MLTINQSSHSTGGKQDKRCEDEEQRGREARKMIRLEVERGVGDRDEDHCGEPGSETTYSQLLALAERSAQQSIRTQRRTESSVMSRGSFFPDTPQ